MVALRLTNRRLFVSDLPRKIARALDAAMSYNVAGGQFSAAFKAHRWDGKEHLLKFSDKLGYYCPAGLVVDVLRVLRASGTRYTLKDETVIRGQRRQLQWNSAVVLRDYQNAAVRSVMAAPLPGIGILKLPIRSGKTKTAGKIIHRLGLKTLFVVPSQMLLNQTAEALAESLLDCPIGRIGDGHHEEEFVTVATIQSLAKIKKRKAEWKIFREAFDVIIVDELHHYGGNGGWHTILYDLDARFKIGLSATVFMQSETQIELGIIWCRAIFGPIRIDISTSELIRRGFLMQQNVEIHEINKPNLSGQRWSQTLREEGITRNAFRNLKIAKLAEAQASAGRRVLIIANRLDHIGELSEQLDVLEVDYRIITGRDGSEARVDKIQGFRDGDYNVLLGTVLSEGVDLPCVETVINAEGGKSDINTVQRQRNLTISDGKTESILIDFMDNTNKYFKAHSKARLEAYRSESAFKIKIVQP